MLISDSSPRESNTNYTHLNEQNFLQEPEIPSNFNNSSNFITLDNNSIPIFVTIISLPTI